MTAEIWRVAEIVVDRGSGYGSSRGSGYLVAPGVVLTGAHVVAAASAVRVRLDVGQPAEVDVQAEEWWADPEGNNGTDLAVVMIPADATAGREVESARFGRISDATIVLTVQAFGYPLFKLRASRDDQGGPGVFRDLEQVTGHAPTAANRRQGILAIYLDDPPPAAPEPGTPSPWAGMSGAAVWAAGRIIAVVAEHHPSEGGGRLTARRIDRAYEQLPEADLGRLVNWLGITPAVSGLADVIPAESGQLIRSAYLAQVRDIAPDVLIDRDNELAEWAEFCAGPNAYAWWQAGPWAGKTALASWFVLHPPVGIDIVSFFITGRLAGQADSDAFLDAMIEQLNALVPADRGSPIGAGVRMGAWLSLLESAAAQGEERGRRLVVVVDGLDEDEAGTAPPRGRPSIASLLPARPPRNVRVLVTSRLHPGVPSDVSAAHPLRNCTIRLLRPSPHTTGLEVLARREIAGELGGDKLKIDIIGFITAAKSGLTVRELTDLTGAGVWEITGLVNGVFGRTLSTRPSNDEPSQNAEPIYYFAHEMLRQVAEVQFGDDLNLYRQRIHQWANTYRDRGWPEDTPQYLLGPYNRLLVGTSEPSPTRRP